jgi:hypothetical protein
MKATETELIRLARLAQKDALVGNTARDEEGP